MKKIAIMIAAALALTAPMSLYAAGQNGPEGEHKIRQGGHQSDVVHEEVVDGVKATFKIISMKEHMEALDMKVPKDMKETHHITVEFKSARSGKTMTDGDVMVKVRNPDKTDQTKELKKIQWHFGGDLDLSKKGKYDVICRFQLKEGKIHTAKFWYDVK